jgi:hypothetical protein
MTVHPATAAENKRRPCFHPFDLQATLIKHLLLDMRTFRDAGITGDFVHKPLQNPKNEIRLIDIKPSDVKSDEIECTISTHDLGNASPYAAISYTWGDMISMHNIRLDG